MIIDFILEHASGLEHKHGLELSCPVVDVIIKQIVKPVSSMKIKYYLKWVCVHCTIPVFYVH